MESQGASALRMNTILRRWNGGVGVPLKQTLCYGFSGERMIKRAPGVMIGEVMLDMGYVA